MWAIDNRTPYAVGKTWDRDQEGQHQWIVAVKGTFDVHPDGHTTLAEQQNEPLLAPQYTAEPGLSSLRYAADLLLPKPTTDILVNGSAHAPGGRPSSEFTVSVQVGAVKKRLLVHGDRTWDDGIFGSKPSRASPVLQVPLAYERAFGGYDSSDADPRRHRLEPRNPVGCGLMDASGRRIGALAPNFEYPDGDVEKTGPAGFGPIDSHWSPRRELMGTYDDTWRAERLPLLPADWKPQSLLCAPADQQPPHPLWGGEPVELINLHPSGTVRFVLPRVHLAFATHIDRRVEEHRARLSTVIIEPDMSRVMMVWTTSLACRSDGDYLERTVVREKRLLS